MKITGKTRLAGVAGWPVAHSWSPAIHNRWLDLYGIDGAYLPVAIQPDRLESAIRGLADAGFRGLNITLPFKEKALQMADCADDAAQAIGAANTLIFHADGRIEASNTDAHGFMANIRQQTSGRILAGKAVILGAGGAARAIAWALGQAGLDQVTVANRTFDRAQALSQTVAGNIVPVSWDDLDGALADADLLVNTTSLGMPGQPQLEIDLARLSATALVTDVVYTPLETGLLAAARARGNPVVDGLGMLLHQAVPGFEAWFGVRPAVDEALRRFVLEG